MIHSRAQAGKASPVLLGLVVLGLLAFLLVVDPLGLGLFESDSPQNAALPGDLLGADAPGGNADEAGANVEAMGLAGRYGEGDLGALRLRLVLMRGDARPALVGQLVTLTDRRGQTVAEVPSDAAGVVLFAQVMPARGYSLHIEGEQFSPVRLQGISVHPQATNDLGDIVLGKDVVIRGRVIDAAGRAVPGTNVSINTIVRGLASKGMLVYMAEQAATVPPPLVAATADGDGYFAISSIDDGVYSLLARQSGFASKLEADVIVARARGAELLTIVLGEGATMSGTVKGADGKPLIGAQVFAVAGGRRMSMARNLQREVGITDAKGAYSIDTLSPGDSYRSGVVAEGYAPVYDVNETEVKGNLVRDFTLVKGGNLTGVVTDEATGKPVVGARVAVYVGEMGWGGRVEAGAKAAADVRQTDEQGRFYFAAISPGPVSSAVVQASGYVSESFSAFPPPGNSWPSVEAEATTEVVVVLKRGGSVRGIVKTAEGGTPVQGAEVTIMQTGWAAMASMWVGTPSGVTGADGVYVLTGVTPGTYRLLAVAGGFSPPGGEEGVEITIGEGGGAVERDLELIAAGSVTGTIRDPAGEPIAGGRIRIRPGPTEGEGGRGGRRGANMAREILTSGTRPADRTDESGVYRLEGLGTDTMWVVQAESDEYVSGESKPFKLAAGELKELDITMLPGGSLRGVVVGESGQRLAGARVQVGRLPDELLGRSRISGWEAQRAFDGDVIVTDEEGRFFAPNLKPGRQLVRATKDDYVAHFKRNISIAPGQAFENYTIALNRGEIIEGVVLGADGRPVPRATVSVTTDPNPGGEQEADTGNETEDVEPTMFARADEQGRFKIENIKPGVYNVVVWFANGHKGWMRDNSEAAMHRNVSIPGEPQNFKLEKADPAAAG
ncbi:MAG: carboxypeptidase regulatory-like domain-containing protein, partial [Planctomycetota bacterium]|nr:carboxypeptidase regulatory-like domain-containing protein [Planctomycetota bacterium]